MHKTCFQLLQLNVENLYSDDPRISDPNISIRMGSKKMFIIVLHLNFHSIAKHWWVCGKLDGKLIFLHIWFSPMHTQ